MRARERKLEAINIAVQRSWSAENRTDQSKSQALIIPLIWSRLETGLETGHERSRDRDRDRNRDRDRSKNRDRSKRLVWAGKGQGLGRN